MEHIGCLHELGHVCGSVQSCGKGCDIHTEFKFSDVYRNANFQEDDNIQGPFSTTHIVNNSHMLGLQLFFKILGP